MTCNRDRNRLHCKFNRNRPSISRLNLEIFILHHCAMNRSFGGWVSSFYHHLSWLCFRGGHLPSVCVKSR